MAIQNTLIGNVNTPITTGLTGSNAITTVIVCNTNVYDPANPALGLAHLYLYAVPSGSATTDTQLIVNKLPIPAGETVTFDQEKMVLSDGDSLVAKSDVNNVLTATVSTLAV